MEIKQGSNITVNIKWDSFSINSLENISFLSVMFETYDKFPCCTNVTNCQNIAGSSCNNYQNYNQLPCNISKCDCRNQHGILLDNYRYCDNKHITDDIDLFPTFVFPKEVLSYCGEYRIVLTIVYKKGVVYKLIIDFGIQFVLTRNNNMENNDVTISLEGSNATSVVSSIKGLHLSNSENSVVITADQSDSASKSVSVPQASDKNAGIISADSWVKIKNVLDNWTPIPTIINIENSSDGSLFLTLANENESLSSDFTIPIVTNEKNGIMSFEDKVRLDSLYEDRNSIKAKIINNTLIL